MNTKISIVVVTTFMIMSSFAQDKTSKQDQSKVAHFDGRVYVEEGFHIWVEDGIDSINTEKSILERQLKLLDQSNEETIYIDINKSVAVFKLNLQTIVSKGKLRIEIYDPGQDKVGMFSVGTQLNSEIEEIANGQINKEFYAPAEGKWIVKIIPEKADGEIMIYTETKNYKQKKNSK